MNVIDDPCHESDAECQYAQEDRSPVKSGIFEADDERQQVHGQRKDPEEWDGSYVFGYVIGDRQQ